MQAQLKQIIEQENLDQPKDSVEFLQHYQKQTKKVASFRKKLESFSKFLLVVGVGALCFAAYKACFATAQAPKFAGRSHRLGASASVQDDASSQAFNALSLAIWGLVVSKAKNGLAAAQEKEASTVQGMLKKSGIFCALIVLASVFQMMGTMHTANPVEAVSKTVSAPTPKLKAMGESHMKSFYDKKSSHYMGGAHNVLLNAPAQQAPLAHADSFYDESSSHYMGGVHNVLINAAKEGTLSAKARPARKSHNAAQNVLEEMHQQFKRDVARGSTGRPVSAKSQRVQQAAQRQNMRETGAFVAFISVLALTMAYFVTFKAYHAHMHKLSELTALMNNPNARVAAGTKGKDLAKKLVERKVEEAIVPEKAADSIEELILAAKAKKALDKAAEEKAAKSMYEAPALFENSAPAPTPTATAYQLIDPVVPSQPYIYPQNFSVHPPVPSPHIVSAALPKVAISKPEPMREPERKTAAKDLSKAELIKLLLTQLAKDGDLEK